LRAAPAQPAPPASRTAPTQHAALSPYGAPAQYAALSPYGAPAQYAAPVIYAAPGVPPAALLPPPRIRWTRRQTAAALLSSWVGQTLMALATHFLIAFALVVGLAFLMHSSGDPVGEIEADSFTATIALWSSPERVWATALIGTLLGGGTLALGAVVSAQWGRSAGLAKPHRSAWLAWLCTTATTGLFGIAYWPGAIMLGMIGMVMSSTAALSLASMWGTLFGLLAMAVVLTGGVGVLYGWLFLSTSRPRVDPRAIAAAAAAAEEAAARARDEAELT
ncbi:hypothetical protein NWP09_13055, partial [Agrococcus sp. HG114]|nr:hypothetical protein [Agrococcus sp. HG114]